MSNTTSSVTYHSYAHSLPNLPAYAAAGLIPESQALNAAVAKHAGLVDDYYKATSNRDEADAVLRNVATDTEIITRAILRGEDPDEAADKASAERAEVQRATDRAAAILGAYRRPILESAWALMGLVEDYAPAALKQIEQTLIKQGEAVDKARRAVTTAEAALRETVGVAAWLDGTHQRGGELFPQIDSSVHLFE